MLHLVLRVCGVAGISVGPLSKKMLQCVAVCCSVLQRVAAYCSVLQCVAGVSVAF